MSVSAAIPSTSSRQRQVRAIGRWLIGFSVGLYAALLIVYLVLRLWLADSFWWLALLHNFAPYYFVPLLIVLPLLWMVGMRRTLIRLLPLVLIGVWLYGPRFVPKATAIGEPALKIVTFNIQFALGGLEGIVDWLLAGDADLVLLQEVGPDNSAHIFALLGEYYPYTVDLVGTTQATLSRLSIIHHERIDLSLTDDQRTQLGSWFADRLVVEVEGEPLTVYNVHLPLPVRDTPRLALNIDNGLVQLALHYDEIRRNILTHNLLTMIDEEPLPYIVAGDFNTSDNALIYHELAVRMHDSFREVAVGLGSTWPINLSGLQPLVRLDYVWHSNDLRALTAEIGPTLGSDHLPLVVTLARQ